MLSIVVALFVIGYAAIVFEHPLKLDKTVPTLLMGSLIWAVISLAELPVVSHLGEVAPITEVLLHHSGKIAEILFFLFGAMTIVELVDLHQGFSVITNRINTQNKTKMLWIISILAFFLSSVLDNLTTTIVLISLLRKLVHNKEERLWYAAMVVIAANAGGAWTPIGDVTTTMLWIGHKVSSGSLITNLFLPSVVCLLVPLLILSQFSIFKKGVLKNGHGEVVVPGPLNSSTVMLIAGISGLIFVPIFKTITHLPPYLGMLLSLGTVWLISEYIHPDEDFKKERQAKYSARNALSRIEWSSIIFFLGILLAIGGLESVVANAAAEHPVGLLRSLAEQLGRVVPNESYVAVILGYFSAIIDNVPLVAAVMGMYPDAMDASIWHFIAYTAGTGGSMLIIGSAAGVAAMGMERIDFIWYAKNITWVAMLGYLAGVGVLLLMQ
ncbi:MAG: sodium:proton antiporter NhaD [Saprospirales bacterium]|nr:sodium:proton antiporter NhaD [Saprospirales bacterium]MBK8489435.1 sodium:proton antiporter NhaD [Saprospirales bacterium]